MVALEDVFIDPAAPPDAVQVALWGQGLTDGLPVIPPTPERVAAMLGGRSPDRVVARLAPAQGEASLYRLAFCAVMAGCEPRHFPVLIAATQAVAQPPFNLLGLQTTTGSAAVALILNGPLAARLQVNAGCNALGPGALSNAVMGRALALILRNVGGAVPGTTDLATMGQPGKYAFCFAENEKASPWAPLHVSRGFSARQNTVTVVGAAGTLEVKDDASRSAEALLATFAHSMLAAGSLGGGTLLGGGEAVVLLAPEHAAIIGRTMSRTQAQAYVHQHATLPFDQLSPDVAAHLREKLAASPNPRSDALLRVAGRPEDILFLVVGGVGVKSTYIPTWGGTTRAITVAIDEPDPEMETSGGP